MVKRLAPAARPQRTAIILGVLTFAALTALAILWPRPGPASANPLTGVAAVTGGEDHTCVLTTAGGLKCWGANEVGQLGDGTAMERATQVDVVGLSSGVAAVAAGGSHTCALTTAGGLKCWGAGFATTPVDVVGLTSGVAAVAAGGSHTCALTTAGGLKCWGANEVGQLGDGTTTNRATPVDVVGLASGVAAVSAGQYHTCALTTAGGLKCWGSNFFGQLGDGTTTYRTTPVDVSGLTSGVAAVAAGSDHTCALTAGGGAKCWGLNTVGQLGDATTSPHGTPVAVSGLNSGVAAVAAAGSHTCALTTAGGLKCWGFNSYGQLGDGTTTHSTSPVDVLGFGSRAAAVGAGYRHSCAVTTAGGLKCWGDNWHGQLGDGKGGHLRASPVNVLWLTSGVAAVAAGSNHTCALTTGGGAKCWGAGSDTTPVDVVGLTSGVAAVAAGANHTCALTTGGGVKCWGTTPVDVVGVTSGVVAVAAGYWHGCAVTTEGGLKCWGRNSDGQLGDGTTTHRTTSVDVSGLTSGVAAVAAGGAHTCALTTAGGLKCWGRNFSGQLGNGTTTDSSTPLDVPGMTSGVAAVAAGEKHTCAVTTAGGLKCWGRNSSRQLGAWSGEECGPPPYFPCSTMPLDVSGLNSGVAAVAAGVKHTCAVTTAGGLKCWGSNEGGQLGDGTRSNRATPVDVLRLTSGVAAVAAGGAHTCALTTAGGLKCWGWNGFGQLGMDWSLQRSTPADAVVLDAKLRPTPTPCPPEGCATPTLTPTPTRTPTPTPCPAEVCATHADISLNVKGGTCDDPSKPSKCTVPLGDSFTLSVSVNSLPPDYEPTNEEDGAGPSTCWDGIDNGGDTVPDAADPDCLASDEKAGYIAIQSDVLFGTNLTYKRTDLPADEIVWPDSALPLRNAPGDVGGIDGRVRHAAATGILPPFPVSTHLGNVVEITLTCTATPSQNEILFLSYDPRLLMEPPPPVDLIQPLPDALTRSTVRNGSGAGFKLQGGQVTVPARPMGTENLDLDGEGGLDGVLVLKPTPVVSFPVPTAALNEGDLIDYPIADSLEINCSEAAPAVGGIAVDLDGDRAGPALNPTGSSGGNGGLVASVIAAVAAAALGATAWYARRRRLG